MEQPVSFAEPRPVKLTVDDFAVLHRAGAFDARGRVELIEGMIVEMSPIRRRHTVIADELYFRLRLALAAIGSPMMPLTATTIMFPRHNALECDVVVTRAAGEEFYVQVEEVELVVEVAFSTLNHDLTTKRDLYAQGGVPEMWVVDGEAGRLHQFWMPVDGRYAETCVVPMDGKLRSATLPDVVIDGAAIL